MFVRTGNKSVFVDSQSALLDFLCASGRKDQGGVCKVTGDVELIAAVPFSLAAKEVDGSQGVPWTFSTFDLDRFDERIDPEGWEFSQYLKNPVVEWSHRYDIPAIGRAECLHVDEKGLHGAIIFNSKDFDPFGWGIGQRVLNGVIRAGSVGFRVLEIEIPDKEAGKDGTTLIFRKQELLEFSICNVPANPFALAKGITKTKQDIGPSSFWGNIIRNFEGANYGQ
jgi:HK97 family phage prohead protease